MDGGLVARVVILARAIAESAIETLRLSMEDALNESVLRHTPPVAYGYPPGVPATLSATANCRFIHNTYRKRGSDSRLSSMAYSKERGLAQSRSPCPSHTPTYRTRPR